MSEPAPSSYDFAWDDIDPDHRAEIEATVLHKLKQFLFRLGDWIHAGGGARPEGVMIRSHIAFWDVLPYLSGLSQTELAQVMGMRHKQSVGREVSSFRDKFSWFNGHMQSERAREVCRKRERSKKAGVVFADSTITTP